MDPDRLDDWRARARTVGWAARKDQDCAFENMHMIANGDVASVWAEVRFGETHDGTTHGLRSPFTAALRRVDGQWKIVQHTSMPNGFETPRAIPR